MKGILLCGGMGTRLRPATFAMNKHMVPILNKPMVLYPLETLKSLGITDILLVSGGNHIGSFAEFLGDGSEYGVTLTYRVQKEAGGIAQALGLAKDFAQGEQIAVILGDNVFENDFVPFFEKDVACLYLKYVHDAHRFGVFMDGKIVEKPATVAGGMAVTGLYIYPANVFDILPTLKPSGRGELEITDVNNAFISTDKCALREIKGFWSDAGTPESLATVTKWAYERNH
jgi:glucose-1-phosphate thymidylyltransferase